MLPCMRRYNRRIAMPLFLILSLSSITFITMKGSRILMTLYAVDLGAGPLVVGILFALYGLPPFLLAVVAGRIANRLDLGGTNCVVDAACASSLSALHLAAMELAAGRCDMAITGGVDTLNDIFMYMCFSNDALPVCLAL